MKRFVTVIISILALCSTLLAEDAKVIRISTNSDELILLVQSNGLLEQVYFGSRLNNEPEVSSLYWDKSDEWNVMNGTGRRNYYETAAAVTHNDGNLSVELKYVSHTQKNVPGGTETVINLKDSHYPLDVKLIYTAYKDENVFTCRTEFSHNEKKPIILNQYASNMLYFRENSYYLNQFTGNWAREATIDSQELKVGKKVLDTRLGSRSAMFTHPFFQLGLGSQVSETSGNVLVGTIAWTGNFRFTFEVDESNNLRVISGINSTSSEYSLAPGTIFRTPEFIYTLSHNGAGEATRNLHDWARRYCVKDGMGDRMTLLNNWENTLFSFDQEKLSSLMYEAKALGVDMFLLDDGWFGNGDNARNDDRAGLGDWDVNRKKLPEGIPALVKAAKDAGVKFGIWIEPEMVNPKSELFTKHPDWAIVDPNRETVYFRNQLVLDMSNPKVQDYVFGVVDKIMKENPEVAFFKWDCNSPITNAYSPYLGEKQSQLYVDHTRGVYSVLERVKAAYPDLPMMMCSGGGARCDYEGLKYFDEFWCSDMTDPVDRCYIQWGFSHIFPVKTMCAHVTNANRTASVKFRMDVASMCKLGFDIGLQTLSKNELEFCRQAVNNWNNLKPVILDGDLYHLVSPY